MRVNVRWNKNLDDGKAYFIYNKCPFKIGWLTKLFEVSPIDCYASFLQATDGGGSFGDNLKIKKK